jgi:hypothetical protein
MTSQESSLRINDALKSTLNDFLKFPLSEAIAGRRARRFCMGAEIPDGVLSFKSKHDPQPLNEIEQLLLLSYMGGVTGSGKCNCKNCFSCLGHRCHCVSLSEAEKVVSKLS